MVEHKYTFEIYNGRVKIKIDGYVAISFNQIDFLGYYSFKDDENILGISFFFLREGAGGFTFDFYAKTKPTWLSILKLLDENL
jgi:hypothetical protein